MDAVQTCVKLIDIGSDLNCLTSEIAQENCVGAEPNIEACTKAFKVIDDYINVADTNYTHSSNKYVTFKKCGGYISTLNLNMGDLDIVTADLKNIADESGVSYEDLSRMIAKHGAESFRGWKSTFYPLVEYFILDLRTTPEA